MLSLPSMAPDRTRFASHRVRIPKLAAQPALGDDVCDMLYRRMHRQHCLFREMPDTTNLSKAFQVSLNRSRDQVSSTRDSRSVCLRKPRLLPRVVLAVSGGMG